MFDDLNNVETSICPQQDGYGDVVFLSLGIPGIPRKKPKLHWCLKGPIGSVFVGKNSSASELFVGTPKKKRIAGRCRLRIPRDVQFPGCSSSQQNVDMPSTKDIHQSRGEIGRRSPYFWWYSKVFSYMFPASSSQWPNECLYSEPTVTNQDGSFKPRGFLILITLWSWKMTVQKINFLGPTPSQNTPV